MTPEELESFNEVIWEQHKWGNHKLAKLLEEDLLEEFK